MSVLGANAKTPAATSGNGTTVTEQPGHRERAHEVGGQQPEQHGVVRVEDVAGEGLHHQQQAAVQPGRRHRRERDGHAQERVASHPVTMQHIG